YHQKRKPPPCWTGVSKTEAGSDPALEAVRPGLYTCGPPLIQAREQMFTDRPPIARSGMATASLPQPARQQHKPRASQRPRRQHPRNRTAQRRHEIEVHARRMQAANTDDFDGWLIPWAQHNADSAEPVGALMLAAKRMGGKLSEADAIALIDEAKASPKPCKA